MVLDFDEAPIHPVIDERIDASLTHCQPVEEKVDVADVGDGGDLRVVVGVDEVDVVGGPAHHEDDHHQRQHLHDLHLVAAAPGEGGLALARHQTQGGLVAEVARHLHVAHTHPQHRQHVGQYEQQDVVPGQDRMYLLSTLKYFAELTCSPCDWILGARPATPEYTPGCPSI